MGIDIKEARNVIHFGPSQTVESYLQKCGRLGRDGGRSRYILFYNGFLTSRCSADMKELREMLKHFSGDHKIAVEGCRCCDVCAQGCLCSGIRGRCLDMFKHDFSVNDTQYTYLRQRIISNQQKKELSYKLVSYANALQKNIGKQACGSPQISQIIDNAWRTEHALGVLKFFSELFEDVDVQYLNFQWTLVNI